MSSNSTSVGVAGATLILLGVTAFGAFLSGTYWFIFLQDQGELIRYGAVTGSVVFSFAGAACAFMAAKRPLKESVGLMLAAVIFMGGDCAQNAMGYQTLGQLANGVTEKQTAHSKAVADLMALPTPDAEGAIRQISTYEQTRSALKENVAMTKAELETAQRGNFDLRYVLAGFALLQIALLLAFRGLGKGKRPEPQPATEAAPVAQQTTRTVHKSYDPKVVNLMDQIGKQVSA